MGTEMDTSGNRTALGVSSDVAQLVGGRLRQAREAIGRSTTALSAKIKVREHYLVAIENGQWDELPPGLNGRGLVRIYARELAVSVPELDQAANQAVMPAEQDAQAPYQVGHTREARPERDFGAQRVHPNTDPVVSQAADSSSPTNALGGAVSKQKQSSAAYASSKVQSLRPSAQGSNRLGLTPEEQPIDVTTPDVASILGISLDLFDEAEPSKNQTKPSVASSTVEKRPAAVSRGRQSEEEVLPITAAEPTVSMQVEGPESYTSESVAHESERITLNKQSNKKSSKKHSRVHESSVAAPAESGVARTVVHHGATSSESTELPTPVAAAPSESVEHPTSVAAAPSESVEHPTPVAAAPSESVAATAVPAVEEMQTTSDESGVAAAEAYLKSHAPKAEEFSETSAQTVGIVTTKLRWAVGLLAACVGILIVGRTLLSEQESVRLDEPTSMSQKDEFADPSGSVVQIENDATIQALNDESLEAQSSVQKAVSGETATDTETPAEAAQLATEVNAAESSDSANTISETNSVASVSDNSTGVTNASDAAVVPTSDTKSYAQLQGASRAVLQLTEAVEIQLTVDGTRIFSGKHESGAIDLKFDKRLEIFVQDGSKAILKYSGWNHGALGRVGRKRRIVLNSGSFE